MPASGHEAAHGRDEILEGNGIEVLPLVLSEGEVLAQGAPARTSSSVLTRGTRRWCTMSRRLALSTEAAWARSVQGKASTMRVTVWGTSWACTVV